MSVRLSLRQCAADGCARFVSPKSARGMCALHYQRVLRTGTSTQRPCAGCREPLERGFQNSGPKYCSDTCKPRCSVDGCDQPARKQSWCASHYAQARRTGCSPKPFKYRWGERSPCLVCQREWEPGHYRRFCSSACMVLYREHNGRVPSTVRCVACGCDIDLTQRGKGGQRRKASTKFCRPCKQDYSKYKLSARELALRDGVACGICGDPVDMDLRRSQSGMCASVDHVIPRALGGTHEPENLQLAHLYCNQVKSDLRGLVSPAKAVI